ncbi:uncharacterized protein BEWA_032940 [Theileria equi strain WA]|uniref:ER membrane protein complex subunit 6 n=1 Tax=Theileria equi strain WA TaxID=1537102 RepID=L0AZM2_THEEQ|nr:uncharacterized protein BEWA_032940 [Theileria equi strain WA]AFZ80441.1 membrane protein, putative [Theileria equi strain WA]|eukprot:XP_004830107.1 uncharacterized protein BEWA_032940 [Theileria equi strain WA]
MLKAIASRSRYELELSRRQDRDDNLIKYNLHLLSLQRSTSSIIIGIVVGILNLSSLLGIATYIAFNGLSGLFVCMNINYKTSDYFVKGNSPFFHNLFVDSLVSFKPLNHTNPQLFFLFWIISYDFCHIFLL